MKNPILILMALLSCCALKSVDIDMTIREFFLLEAIADKKTSKRYKKIIDLGISNYPKRDSDKELMDCGVEEPTSPNPSPVNVPEEE